MQIKGPIFSIITPFTRNGSIDYKSLKKKNFENKGKMFYKYFS